MTQLLSTSSSVITLGQQANVPLMCSASELAYGYEPHDHIYSAVMYRAPLLTMRRASCRGRVYPGWCG